VTKKAKWNAKKGGGGGGSGVAIVVIRMENEYRVGRTRDEPGPVEPNMQKTKGGGTGGR